MARLRARSRALPPELQQPPVEVARERPLVHLGLRDRPEDRLLPLGVRGRRHLQRPRGDAAPRLADVVEREVPVREAVGVRRRDPRRRQRLPREPVAGLLEERPGQLPAAEQPAGSVRLGSASSRSTRSRRGGARRSARARGRRPACTGRTPRGRPGPARRARPRPRTAARRGRRCAAPSPSRRLSASSGKTTPSDGLLGRGRVAASTYCVRIRRTSATSIQRSRWSYRLPCSAATASERPLSRTRVAASSIAFAATPISVVGSMYIS